MLWLRKILLYGEALIISHFNYTDLTLTRHNYLEILVYDNKSSKYGSNYVIISTML